MNWPVWSRPEAPLAAQGYPLRPYDRRFIGNSNFARIPHLKTLMDATIGIVGLGEVGREIASRARAFEMTILYYQRTRLSDDDEMKLGVHYAALNDLVAQSDYVVLQLPLNDSTRHIMGREQFKRIKPGAILVNAARAGLMDRGGADRGAGFGAGWPGWASMSATANLPCRTIRC